MNGELMKELRGLALETYKQITALEARIAALERPSNPMDFPAIDESLIDQPKEQK